MRHDSCHMKRRFFVGGPRVLGQSGLAVSRLAEVAPIRQPEASQVQITAPSAADRSGAAWGRRRGPPGLNLKWDAPGPESRWQLPGDSDSEPGNLRRVGASGW